MDRRCAIDTGCQWFQRCESCPWADCVLKDDEALLDYDEERSFRMRVKRAFDMVAAGHAAGEVARLMGMEAEALVEALGKVVGAGIDDLAKAIVDARMGGMHEKHVAEKFKVHPRTVRRYCRGVEFDRASGNSIREYHRPYANGAV